jgi:hypothetical protein
LDAGPVADGGHTVHDRNAASRVVITGRVCQSVV